MPSWLAPLIEGRISANHFDPTRPLDDATIATLVHLATRAPSAFNFQNWSFVAVRSREGKERLKSLAYGQQKVVDAAVTFIVSGTLMPHARLALALEPAVRTGVMPQATAEGWVDMAHGMYADNLGFQRDEAIRSASLAAMTLMLAAAGMGLASGPMIGFDAAGVSRSFGLSAAEVPALLVAVGHAAPGNWPQKPRRPVEEVLRLA